MRHVSVLEQAVFDHLPGEILSYVDIVEELIGPNIELFGKGQV